MGSPEKTRSQKGWTAHRRACGQFRRDEKGGSTVEFVLWLPIFLMLFFIASDMAHLYTVNGGMWDGARNAARAMSLHRASQDEALEIAKGSLVGIKEPYDIDISYNWRAVTVEITVPANAAGLTGHFSHILGMDLTARVTMMREPV